MTQAAIVMYASGWCPYCQRARNLLGGKNLTFTEIDVEDDPRFRQEMITRSGRSSVPQIFVADKPIGGFDELSALDRSGELDRMLEEKR